MWILSKFDGGQGIKSFILPSDGVFKVKKYHLKRGMNVTVSHASDMPGRPNNTWKHFNQRSYFQTIAV